MTAMRSPLFINGAEGNRTLDLLNAIQALSQLSYGPMQRSPAIIRDGMSQDYWAVLMQIFEGIQPVNLTG
jgi:hypothetical protein